MPKKYPKLIEGAILFFYEEDGTVGTIETIVKLHKNGKITYSSADVAGRKFTDSSLDAYFCDYDPERIKIRYPFNIYYKCLN